jgi:hypothetical protein
MLAPLAVVAAATFQATGAPVTGPVTEGPKPEAGTDLQPAEPETTMHHDRARKCGRIPAGIVMVWPTAATMLIRPNGDAFRRGGRIPPGLRRRKAADRNAVPTPATARGRVRR